VIDIELLLFLLVLVSAAVVVKVDGPALVLLELAIDEGSAILMPAVLPSRVLLALTRGQRHRIFVEDIILGCT
jgi:hypothetical protein